MALEGRPLGDDPLAGWPGYNAKEDRRHDRRTLGVDELLRLIDAAHAEARSTVGMTGPRPRPLLPAGRRHGPALLGDQELHARLVRLRLSGPGDCRPPPTRRTASPRPALPLHATSDVRLGSLAAPAARARLPAAPTQGADMLKVDLEAADCPYRDASGLVFDFIASAARPRRWPTKPVARPGSFSAS